MAPVVVYSPEHNTSSMAVYRAMLSYLYICFLHVQGIQPPILMLEVQRKACVYLSMLPMLGVGSKHDQDRPGQATTTR